MSTLIEVDHLSRYFGKVCAVNDISFTLERGQVLGFLGINGAGKTTTLQMLSGNLAPSNGNIKIKDFTIINNPIQAKQCIGYLPDTPPLYKDLTVTEFLIYCAKIHGVSKHEIKKTLENVLQRCALISVKNRLISNLSKGYQQRIGIAQALIHNPDIIILDEPTVGLDPLQIKEIRQLIKKLSEDHGIIISTHNLSEAEEVCSQVQIIHKGCLIVKERITELMQSIKQCSLLITTKKPIDCVVLNAIDGVNAIEKISDYQVKINYLDSLDPTQSIIQCSLLNNWVLIEVTPIKKSLEEIFISYIDKEQS